MSLAPIVIAILVAKILLAAGVAGRSPRPLPRGRTWQTAIAVLGWTIVAPYSTYLAVANHRAAAAYVPGTVFLVTVLLWPFARHVLAPLGLVRASYYVAYLAWHRILDREGSALVAAAIALHRQAEPDPADVAWIEERIQKNAPMRGGGIVAAGAMAALRGDREAARALFESVRSLDTAVCSASMREIAAEWLAAEAAARGDWEKVVELGAGGWLAGRTNALLASVGKRLLGHEDAPSRASLALQWLLAPRRMHTLEIVERALSVQDGAAPPGDDLDDEGSGPVSIGAPEGDLLARALSAHVALLAAKKPTAKDVARVGRAFDLAFAEEDAGRGIEERGALLGAMRAHAVLARLRADVEESLFQLMKAHRLALDDAIDEPGEVAGSAQRRLRDETLAVIEALSDAVRRRVSERRALSPIDEWREFTALRIAYERGVGSGGPELRYLAFTKVHGDLCALAVWLFNERKERPIANAMFRFLLLEATAVGDSEAITLQTKNVGCGT